MFKSQILLPLMLTLAVVSWSPHTQLYSPLSSGTTLLIRSSFTEAVCFIWYFSPEFRTFFPFFHSTGTPGLESSQCSVTLVPSSASWLSSFCLKVTGWTDNLLLVNRQLQDMRTKVHTFILLMQRTKTHDHPKLSSCDLVPQDSKRYDTITHSTIINTMMQTILKTGRKTKNTIKQRQVSLWCNSENILPPEQTHLNIHIRKPVACSFGKLLHRSFLEKSSSYP